MNFQYFLIVFGVILIQLMHNSRSEVTDFDFLMFENFGLNADNFVQELKLVKLLKEYRRFLAQHAMIIRRLRQPRGEAAFGPIEANNILVRRFAIKMGSKKAKHWFDHVWNETTNEAMKDFPHEADYHGAAKGIVFLQETHKLEPLKMAKGVLRFDKQVRTSPDCMNVKDLYTIATVALDLGWYDNGIMFLRVSRIRQHGGCNPNCDYQRPLQIPRVPRP